MISPRRVHYNSSICRSGTWRHLLGAYGPLSTAYAAWSSIRQGGEQAAITSCLLEKYGISGDQGMQLANDATVLTNTGGGEALGPRFA